jgi:hypothetical protein
MWASFVWEECRRKVMKYLHNRQRRKDGGWKLYKIDDLYPPYVHRLLQEHCNVYTYAHHMFIVDCSDLTCAMTKFSRTGCYVDFRTCSLCVENIVTSKLVAKAYILLPFLLCILKNIFPVISLVRIARFCNKLRYWFIHFNPILYSWKSLWFISRSCQNLDSVPLSSRVFQLVVSLQSFSYLTALLRNCPLRS